MCWVCLWPGPCINCNDKGHIRVNPFSPIEAVLTARKGLHDHNDKVHGETEQKEISLDIEDWALEAYILLLINVIPINLIEFKKLRAYIND